MVIAAEDTERHKPDPAPLLEALRRLGAGAEGACYVGDAPFDLLAGRAAGLTTIAVTWGFFPPARAAVAGARRWWPTPPADLLRACREGGG